MGSSRFIDDEEFIYWCLENKELVELLMQSDLFSFEKVQQAREAIYSRNGNLCYELLENIIDLCFLRRFESYKERNMYAPIAKALGGSILGNADQPDCVVNGVPVEAKNKKFSTKDLKQLRRYMAQMGSSRGIAAAPIFGITKSDKIFLLRVKFDVEHFCYVVENADEAKQWIYR